MENDSIVTDEQVVIGDPKGRNAAIESILSATRPQEIVEETPEESAEQPEVVVENKEDPEEFTLKVLGQERKATKSEVIEAGIRSLQKESAADEKLRVASQKEQEIERREADLKRLETELLTKKATEPDVVGREFAEALLTDDEKVASVITSITREITELKKEVATSKVKEEAQAKITFEKIVKHYHDNFSDIKDDEIKHFAFNKFRNDVLKTEPDPFKATEKAAEMVYQKFGDKPGEPEKLSTTNIKKNLSPQLKKASARVKVPDPPKPETQAEILDRMRKTRSQK